MNLALPLRAALTETTVSLIASTMSLGSHFLSESPETPFVSLRGETLQLPGGGSAAGHWLMLTRREFGSFTRGLVR